MQVFTIDLTGAGVDEDALVAFGDAVHAEETMRVFEALFHDI